MTENLFTRADDDNADLRALATIDPAGPRDPGAHRSPTAQSLLADITAEPASAGPIGSRRRWVWVGTAAAAAAAVLVVAPIVGSQGDGAYASWTDVPAAASAKDAADAEDYCRDMWRDVVAEPADGLPGPTVVDDADLVLAEQRGDFTYTVLSDGTWSMDCLVDRGRWPFWQSGSAGGSIQDLSTFDDPAPDGVSAMSVGAMGPGGADDLLLMLYGRVGADVEAVVVHVPDVGDVEATVTNGYVAAWAPGMSQEGFTDIGPAMTLYLDDGSTVELTPEQVLASGQVAG